MGGTSGANFPHIGLTLTGQTLPLERVMPLRSSHVPSIWQYGHTHVQAQLVHKPYLAFVTHPCAACDASRQTRELFRGARARTTAMCPSKRSSWMKSSWWLDRLAGKNFFESMGLRGVAAVFEEDSEIVGRLEIVSSVCLLVVNFGTLEI